MKPASNNSRAPLIRLLTPSPLATTALKATLASIVQRATTDRATTFERRNAPANNQTQPAPQPAYATKGHFVSAEDTHLDRIKGLYVGQKEKGELVRPPDGKVERFTDASLSVDFNTIDPTRMRELAATGRKALSKLYFFTSGAGLWSRGGGQVKAIIPYNLEELLPPEKLQRLNHSSDVYNAKGGDKGVLLAAGVNVLVGETEALVAARVRSEAKAEIDSILKEARKDSKAVTPLSMKLIQAALMSKAGDTYVPFDVWTSQQTHQPIAEALSEFKKTYRERSLHPDPKVQAEIVEALKRYFEQDEALGETHLFGYQVGLPALHPETGERIHGTAEIGEGAGRAKAYLDDSGRTEELLLRGKEYFSFENIEVMTPWEEVLGAHVESGKEASVVVVPQQAGYSGGNPFVVTKDDGTKNVEFHEQSVLPDEPKKDNLFFNANTIVASLHSKASDSIGFEVKENGSQVRAKNNAADLWHLPTGAVGGVIGLHYENFKTYPEYVKNGTSFVKNFYEQWTKWVASMNSDVERVDFDSLRRAS